MCLHISACQTHQIVASCPGQQYMLAHPTKSLLQTCLQCCQSWQAETAFRKHAQFVLQNLRQFQSVAGSLINLQSVWLKISIWRHTFGSSHSLLTVYQLRLGRSQAQLHSLQHHNKISPHLESLQLLASRQTASGLLLDKWHDHSSVLAECINILVLLQNAHNMSA